jgi:hypothetical protein
VPTAESNGYLPFPQLAAVLHSALCAREALEKSTAKASREEIKSSTGTAKARSGGIVDVAQRVTSITRRRW